MPSSTGPAATLALAPEHAGRRLFATIGVVVAIGAGLVVYLTAQAATAMLRVPARRATTALTNPTPAGSSAAIRDATDATCVAWRNADGHIEAASAMPIGWYWQQAERRASIDALTRNVGAAIDAFVSHVSASDPANVTDAAHSFAAAQREVLGALADHTYDDALAAELARSRANLDRACGVGTSG